MTKKKMKYFVYNVHQKNNHIIVFVFAFPICKSTCFRSW